MANVVLYSRLGGACVIRTNTPESIPALNIHSKPSSVGYLLSFKAVKGKAYTTPSLESK